MLKKAFLASLFAVTLAHAAVVRLDVKERSDILDGKSFGNAGAYERIIGKAYFAINPKLATNQAIADIDKAPRNRDGMVEFSSDVYILRPKDPKKGNSTVLYEVSNRGSKSMLANFNRAPAAPQLIGVSQAGGGLDPRT